MNRMTWKAKDGKEISVVEWAVEKPVGIVQISHGMAEHILRYKKFASYLNGLGFTVFGDDHRCFGETDKELPGYTDGDNWEGTLSDLAGLTDLYREKYHLPVILFAHSYGSFLGQAYLQRYSDKIDGAILCGSDKLSTLSTGFASVVAKIGCAFKGRKAPAELIKKLTFDAYEKKLGGSMISTLPEEVSRYENDEGCGMVCSYGFYERFFAGAKKLYRKEGLEAIRKDLPLLLVAGEHDPVGQYSEGMKRLYAMYQKLGIEDVSLHLFAGARHEILNDVSKEDALSVIGEFLKKRIS